MTFVDASLVSSSSGQFRTLFAVLSIYNFGSSLFVTVLTRFAAALA